ncbi:Mediator of DNA damage checkpoint protein 1 [Trachymyrmex cornetzi]|uniref:Mediator of DNA damage checkpoint protein 1 n=1 Tax=Trachymyrmex cornetzi TaxID=471704 RepID=A0A151IVH5_9HYME|nr:Mediator of DNA damage checkpoint protein 1 [Trachymyrmex cornetzi]
MDFSATQVYKDEDNLFTDSHALSEEESVQVGTLSINSTDYQIKTGITKIGRLDTCNIVIQDDMTVSKLHAEIEASGRGSTWICDLKSLNKTKLNNLILQPNRSYELKDGSVIEFGGVRATYCIYCPANDEVIPETPAPSRQKTANIIIPNTPDSSLNISSSVDNDGSIILGTQKDDETCSVFRRPRVPQQSSSPSINKKNTSKNESNDSLSTIALHTSDINVSENQVSIYEAETQKFDKGYKMTSNSIYDMETQDDLVDISKHVKTNTKNGKQLPRLNVCDKTAGRSVTDIHDMETQNCLDDINEIETQKDNINIRNVTATKFTTDIHTMETQVDTDNIDEDSSNAQKFEIDKEEKQHASRNQRSHNLLDSEVNPNNVNKAETESQNSDIYFSTITTRRKRNILKDTQEFPDSVKDITPDQDINFSQTSKASNEKGMDDNVAQESNERKKRIAKTKHESDSITEILNDNEDKNKIISKNGGQRAQIMDTPYESDDDILMRLPAVRISGTLSNPVSPSASSTSTVHSTKSKRDIARSKGKESTLKGKSLCKQDIENSGKHNKSSIDSQSNLVHDNLMTDKITGPVDTSDESDDCSESTYKRFQQIADRMLSNKHNCPKRQKKRSKESSRVSPNISEDPKQNTDDESKNSWISTKITRHSSKQNDKSPHDLQKETLKSIEATSYEATRSTESETKSIIIESIMARAPSNTRNKNLSIREGSKAKIFKRELRTRSKKQQNSDTETDSVLTESSLSSEIEDSDNTQLDNVVSKAKRKRSAKSSISSLSQVSIKRKEEIFKKPSRIKNSTSSLIDTSTENITGESSQSGTESDTSISSRSLRSRTARKKIESNPNTCRLTDESASSLNTSTETISLTLTPSRTRRSMSILNNSTSSTMKHKVLFTGITGVMENYSEIVKTLGGSKVEDPAQCTVLVTDKVRRTYKFLCALAKSVPIVGIDWLTESKTKKEFIDWEKHILKDSEAETRYDFKLRESLDKAREKKMLDGYIVVLTPNVEPPPIKELKDIVSSCGGKALLRPPTKWPERAIILSRKEDLSNAKKFLAKAPKTVTVQDIEFILTGILRQETDFVKYKLT